MAAQHRRSERRCQLVSQLENAMYSISRILPSPIWMPTAKIEIHHTDPAPDGVRIEDVRLAPDPSPALISRAVQDLKVLFG